jgi:hypothetical protein
MSWLLILVIAAGIGVIARIYVKVRKLRSAGEDDWDSRTINRLRQQGLDPFQPHEVDFFFALPGVDATHAVNAQLERDGCTVDVKAVPDNIEFPYSLHARKAMRLSAADIQELGRRFTALAETHGGRYDGWAADVAPPPPS